MAKSPAIYWADFQARADIINAYKSDPVVALGIPATGKRRWSKSLISA